MATPPPPRPEPPPAREGRAGDGTRRRNVAPLATLLSLSLALLIAWSLAIPIFEAPDEPLHWQYARHLHHTRRLPVYEPGFGEANSPPLYYLLIAPLAGTREQPPAFTPTRPGDNPAPLITPDGIVHPRGLRVYEHRQSDFGRYGPIRLARLLTALISLLAVFLCYQAGREASGRESTGLLAAAFIAFLPQFTFRGGNVSNDALVTTLCALSLFLLLRLLRRGFTWRLGFGAAAAIAAAFLSKISAIFLGAPFVLALLAQKAPLRKRLLWVGVLVGVAVLIVLPWALRNQVLYGDPFASRVMREAVPSLVDPKPLTSPFFRRVFFAQTYRSFVGVFGWMSLPMAEWVYEGYRQVFWLALAGLVVRVLRRAAAPSAPVLLALLLFPLLNFLIVVYINLTFTQPQGRYLFPSLPAIAVLTALGLEGVPFWSSRLSAVLVALLALANVCVLTGTVIPAYWPAPVP